MKTLALVFQNADTPQVIDLMRRTFEEVFARSVQVEAYFMDRIGETEQICADVLVVNRTVSLLALRPHTPSFQNVVFMTRSIRKTYLDSILAIPAGTDVLLVNDTPDSAHEMIEMLYELGIGHLNLIPFEPDREAQGDYRSIQYAITPNEPQLVPARIPHVLNTEYRVVGFDTIINAAAVLNLTSDRIASNLIRLRLASGMTQAEVGEKLNYSDKSISKWERAEALPDAAVLKKMAEIFGVTVDYLLTGHDQWEPSEDTNVRRADVQYNDGDRRRDCEHLDAGALDLRHSLAARPNGMADSDLGDSRLARHAVGFQLRLERGQK